MTASTGGDRRRHAAAVHQTGGRAAKTLAGGEPGSERGPRSTTKGSDRAKLIMAEAERLFRERGYADTSMDDIAQAVGLLKGSLYYYMNSKEDLLYRIVNDVHVQVQAKLDAASALADESALRRLLFFVREQVEYNARHVTQITIYHHEWLRLDGERLEEVRRRRRQQEKQVIRLVEDAKRSGEVPADVDAKLAAASVFAVTIWPYTWYRPGQISPAKLATFCADFVLNALSGTGRT